ncbi:V8-like Glu-specific endopeptidase [Amycolatopsis arida]|uniref:V8-like Glu-specific endopeptidase n=1 Tax=Amycolatopsis arida TaxID=587909 RepID=A0A1I5XSP2_9PSEU|nr:peptidase [Amycolatopsis arida]TDX97285.1 V8-like Glu-specific endopeptidase [Amycolatopsis arida]SFQ34991.1 V8-like Glu-specific endopeptidase [Amycolatopsis arida]
MRRAALRSALITAATGVLTAAFALPAVAQSPVAGSAEAPAVHPAPAAAEAVAKYWTPERMRSAVPMQRLLGARTAPTGSAPVADGAAAAVPPVSPLAFPTTGADWTGGGAVAKTAGRVFFTFGGRNASCSGNAVTSANRSVVITAGHCVKYQGSWHTNWVFVPGYAGGNAPFGEWPARATLTTPQWEASEDINYDIAAAVVGQRDGRSLTDVVGSQGIAFNQPRNQNMYAFGYPAAAPYDGSKLVYCSGRTFTDFLLTRDHGMGCGMTGGSSGGPWFLNFDEATGTGTVASVNSFGYKFLPGNLYGPYFGPEAKALYDRAQAA